MGSKRSFTTALDNLRSDVGRGSFGSQFPTAAVNGETRFPHGSDWPSIREAGDKTEHDRNPTGTLSGASSYGQRKRTCVDPSLHLPSLRGLAGLPKTGTAMGPAAVEPTGIHPRKPGGKYGPTATQNGSQERSNRPALSVPLAREGWSITEQVPTACADAVGLSKKQKPGVMPRTR
jgi:hypothetical protein